MPDFSTIMETNDLAVSLSRIELPVAGTAGDRTFVFSLHSLPDRRRYESDPDPTPENAAGNLKVRIVPLAGETVHDQKMDAHISTAKKLLAKKLREVAEELDK